ncbi:MAG: glycosyltransferase family 2 protein [Scytonematopsis contorta HA4267-MV1]|jgi:hypothetical protein|nr:glycosyltransferase family 2 protein [Scytonematopsis contorta HA4267-MV1]
MRQQHLSVSIILVNYNGADVLPNCLNSLEKYIDKTECEIILVDNASSDGSPEFVAESFPKINLIRLPKNIGFGAGNNAGAQVAKGEFLFLLNTDTILTSNIIPFLKDLMQKRPEVGAIGPKLLNHDGSFQVSISKQIGIKGEFQTRKMHQSTQENDKLRLIEQEYQDIKEVDIIVGAAYFIRADLFNSLSGFDEKFFMYFEESDLCERVKNKGYKILYTPQVSLIHLKGVSTQKVANAMVVEYRRSQLCFYQKHRPIWENFILRVYLFYKFSLEFVNTGNPYCSKILRLVISLKST